MRKEFNAEKEIERIINNMRDYFEKNNLPKKCVVGISGGKDSTVVAALAVKAFGKENVIGIMMPNGTQRDIEDSIKVCKTLDIKNYTINISGSYAGLTNAMLYELGKKEESFTYKTNTPARLRMTTLYGISAMIGGVVLNTCNLSENCAWGNFSTLFGDCSGSFAPIDLYTVTEVRTIGDVLGLPHELVYKAPSDGMCGSTDEIRISEMSGVNEFTYERFDKLIRCEEHDFTPEEVEKLIHGYKIGKFKNEIVRIPNVNPELPNFFEGK